MFVGERRETARVAPTKKILVRGVSPDAHPPLQKGGDQQENSAHPLKDEPENCGADNEKGGTDDDKA